MGIPMRYCFMAVCLFLMACDLPAPTGGSTSNFRTPSAQKQRQVELNFLVVLRQMEPTIEAECKRRRGARLCDFQIIIDDRPDQPANAFQTVLDDGTPILGFTQALLYDVRNREELAFVMGHEAAHHILDHLGRQKKRADREAAEFERQAESVGATRAEIEQAKGVGAQVGVLRFSADYEIEADVLGARLTKRAGFDALKGSAYFEKLPDPGNGVISTHPPNERRKQAVREELGVQ